MGAVAPDLSRSRKCDSWSSGKLHVPVSLGHEIGAGRWRDAGSQGVPVTHDASLAFWIFGVGTSDALGRDKYNLVAPCFITTLKEYYKKYFANKTRSQTDGPFLITRLTLLSFCLRLSHIVLSKDPLHAKEKVRQPEGQHCR